MAARTELSNRTTRLLRAVAAISGGLLVVMSVVADPIGLSGQGIGRGQVFLFVTGAILVAAAVLSHPRRAYRAMALLVFNILVLLALLELAATLYYRVASETGTVENHQGVRERQLAMGSVDYAPFVVWHASEGSAEFMTIGPDGRRVTPQASPDPEAFEVFMFGGSTMIGWCVADSLTIPALLQRDLDSLLNVPVRVVNLGQMAYVNTQEMIELMLQLRSGAMPDLVLFYDGVNEIASAHMNGIAGAHENLSDIAARFDRSGVADASPDLIEFVAGSSNFLSLLRSALLTVGGSGGRSIPAPEDGVEPLHSDSLPADIIEMYVENCRLALALGHEYGFGCSFFWQPVLRPGGARVPVGGEAELIESFDPGYARLLSLTYDRARFLGDSLRSYHYLGDCLDDCPRELFVYDYCHVTAEGNRLVERAILACVIEDGLIPDSLWSR